MSRNVGSVLAASRRIPVPCQAGSGSRALSQLRSLSTVQTRMRRQTLPAPPPGHRAASSSSPYLTRQDSVTDAEEHLNSLFAPLKFPAELADRMLTHASHSSAKVRHNGRLSFMGRRVMQFYLFALLDSSPSLRADHDFDSVAEHALNTYLVGEHVAAAWQLGDVLKWSPPSKALSGPTPKNVGLYKVLGEAVQAIVGGVNHQFGGVVSQRLFYTRVLPHLLLPGTHRGLSDEFHEHAMAMCERLGGPQANLLGKSAQ